MLWRRYILILYGENHGRLGGIRWNGAAVTLKTICNDNCARRHAPFICFEGRLLGINLIDKSI